MTTRSPLSVVCPSCKATAGQRCRHGSRIAAARNAEDNTDRERKLRVAREFYRL